MAKIIDVLGSGTPLLGRLRGVRARHELRQFIHVNNHINFKANDAHLAFQGEVPQPIPDLVTTSERQLVVSRALADVLKRQDETLEIVPVRLVDKDGKTVSTDHVVAAVRTLATSTPPVGGSFIGSYLRSEVRGLDDITAAGLFRVQYTLVIGCSETVAAAIAGFSGVQLVPMTEYVEVYGPLPPPPYQLFVSGTAGARLAIGERSQGDTGPVSEQLEMGASLAATWPADGYPANMTGAKSQKKLVDFTKADGAPVVTAKAKALLEQHDVGGAVEFLPVRVQDHAGKPVKGEHWVMQVTATADYIDVAESDIEVAWEKRAQFSGSGAESSPARHTAEDLLLWSPREVILDASRLRGRPPIFRVPNARYSWVFVRSDIVAAMTAAGLTGFRGEDPAERAYSVEGTSLTQVS